MTAARPQAVVVGATGNLGTAVVAELTDRGYALDPTWMGADHPDVCAPDAFTGLPGRIDVAVYLAGVNVVGDAETLDYADWQRVLDVNLNGAFRFAQAAFPAMRRAGRSALVVISSIMVTHPYPQRVAYTAAKAALEGMARALGVEWGRHGISVNAIRLGHLAGLMRSTRTNPRLLEEVRRHTPLDCLIDPAEVARFIGWLADMRGRGMSGSVVDFDPAYTINRWPVD